MKREIGGWLTSGRRTNRSTTNARTTIAASVAAKATARFHFFSTSETKMSAARKTIAPCAKLKTPEALKISTKPSATREYMTPARSPPMATSRKNDQSISDDLGPYP